MLVSELLDLLAYVDPDVDVWVRDGEEFASIDVAFGGVGGRPAVVITPSDDPLFGGTE